MHNQFKTQKFKHLMLAMGPRDLNSAPYSPVHCSSHSMTSFQSSELTELPVVENSQLFAQRTVRPLGTWALCGHRQVEPGIHRGMGRKHTCCGHHCKGCGRSFAQYLANKEHGGRAQDGAHGPNGVEALRIARLNSTELVIITLSLSLSLSLQSKQLEQPCTARGGGGGSLGLDANPLWDTDACARPIPSGTKQKCKAKVKEKSSSVTCHRRLSLQ